jgi:hypothetical protein
MTKSVDDVHCIDAVYFNAKQRLEKADIGKENKALIENFSIALRREGAAKITITWYLDYTIRMVKQLQKFGFNEILNKLDPNTFDKLLIFLRMKGNHLPALSEIIKN